MNISNKLIPVSDGYMSVYTSGMGSKTIIFLSGGLTSSPILDFKTLYTKLIPNFKIVVIEKFGYGFSDDNDNPRDIDTILEETRSCISALKMDPPFILAPHSMSGLEALRWVEKYPSEIDTIIGLDMADYNAYNNLKINLKGLKLSRFLVKMNLTKLFPKLIESDAVKYGELSLSEKELFSKLFHKNFISKSTLNEIREVKENSVKVKDVKLGLVDLLIFCSNGSGTGIKKDRWFDIQKELSNSSKNKKFFYMDCPHYIHNHKADEIAEIIKNNFL